MRYTQQLLTLLTWQSLIDDEHLLLSTTLCCLAIVMDLLVLFGALSSSKQRRSRSFDTTISFVSENDKYLPVTRSMPP
jgi:hypothetical protein